MKTSKKKRINLYKKKLKGIHCIYSLNAALKAWLTKHQYKKTVKFYHFKQNQGTVEELLRRRSGSRLYRIFDSDKPLVIFYMGTDYDQDNSGMIQALKKFGSLIYFTREDGKYGQLIKSEEGIEFVRQENSIRLLKLFEDLHANKMTPKILIGQMWAHRIDRRIFRKIKEMYGTIVINICMDDRHTFGLKNKDDGKTGTAALSDYIDLAATSAPECVGWYLKEGCPAIFFPEASDPNFFHPIRDLLKQNDVCFVGARYGMRESIVNALEKNNISVTCYGSGWKNGRTPTDKVAQLFATSKIVLGVGTIGYCTDFYALKMRDFDAPMSGSFYITNDNPDIYSVYDVGKEIETYCSVDECIRKVRFYLSNDSQREKIAYRGFQRARKQHTWERRFEHLFETIRLK